MALTTSTTRANVILTEILADLPLGPLTPKVVAWNLINHSNHDGKPSLVRKIPKKSDLGAAVAATEGVAFTLSTTLGYDTSISLTPTEAAVARADITTRALRRANPGMTAEEVYNRISVGDLSGLVTLLREEANDLMRMGWEKAEKDVLALLDDGSNSVGTTTQDLTLANMLAAVALLESLEPEHEQFVWALASQQMADLRSALMAGSGAALSAVLFNSADLSFFDYHPDASRNGFKGSFLNIPIFQTSPSINPLPNSGADVAGALMCLGSGPAGQGGSLRGAHEFCEGHAPKFLFVFDAAARTVSLMMVWEYDVQEHTDSHIISIITDA